MLRHTTLLSADGDPAFLSLFVYTCCMACLALVENRGDFFSFFKGCSERAYIISHIVHASFWQELAPSFIPVTSFFASLVRSGTPLVLLERPSCLPSPTLTSSGDSRCGGWVCGGTREGYLPQGENGHEEGDFFTWGGWVTKFLLAFWVWLLVLSRGDVTEGGMGFWRRPTGCWLGCGDAACWTCLTTVHFPSSCEC